MSLGLKMQPQLELGIMMARAELEAPCLRLLYRAKGRPYLQVTEAGVSVELEFADLSLLRGFRKQLNELDLDDGAKEQVV